MLFCEVRFGSRDTSQQSGQIRLFQSDLASNSEIISLLRVCESVCVAVRVWAHGRPCVCGCECVCVCAGRCALIYHQNRRKFDENL